jgi:hypothetical protein
MFTFTDNEIVWVDCCSLQYNFVRYLVDIHLKLTRNVEVYIRFVSAFSEITTVVYRKTWKLRQRLRQNMTITMLDFAYTR